MRYNAAIPSCLPIGAWNLWPDDGSRMSREAHVRFCESAGLRCPALLTYVEGRLRTREYEARNNGGKRQRTEIIAQRVQFLGTPPADAKSAEVNVSEAASDEVPF